MLRLSLGSWSSCLRMYSQSFLVSSVRGSGSLPTTAASAASGCTGLLRAFLGAAAFFGVGIGQLERAGLGFQEKNQPCFSVRDLPQNFPEQHVSCPRLSATAFISRLGRRQFQGRNKVRSSERSAVDDAFQAF